MTFILSNPQDIFQLLSCITSVQYLNHSLFRKMLCYVLFIPCSLLILLPCWKLFLASFLDRFFLHLLNDGSQNSMFSPFRVSEQFYLYSSKCLWLLNPYFQIHIFFFLSSRFLCLSIPPFHLHLDTPESFFFFLTVVILLN